MDVDRPRPRAGRSDPAVLDAVARRILWLAVRMIHEANHVRPSRDGLKVGGHQASDAPDVWWPPTLNPPPLRPPGPPARHPHPSPPPTPPPHPPAHPPSLRPPPPPTSP